MPSPSATDSSAPRRLRRLEKRLASAQETQAKRTRQAARAQQRDVSRGGARKLLAKRARQLEKATRRAAALAAAISEARAAAARLQVYCLRDRMKVSMRHPEPMTMRNGRAGVAGTCPTCGNRVVRPA